MKSLAATGLVLVLGACAANSVKEVPLADQAHYWSLDRASLPETFPAEDGCFRVKVTIGTDGKVADPKALAVVGQKISAWLPGFLSQLRFDPAPENPGRTPIRTMLTWTLRQQVTTTTVYATSAAAAVKAAMAEAAPADTRAWNEKCQAEMDRQMGISQP